MFGLNTVRRVTLGKAIYQKYQATPIYATATCTYCKGSGNLGATDACNLCRSTSIKYGPTENDNGHVHEAWRCLSCGHSYFNPITVYPTCNSCGGKGYNTTTTISHYARGSYIAEITAEYGTYPDNGRHSDGYWYTFVKMFSVTWIKVGGVWKLSNEVFVKINGVWHKSEVKKNINGIWK